MKESSEGTPKFRNGFAWTQRCEQALHMNSRTPDAGNAARREKYWNLCEDKDHSPHIKHSIPNSQGSACKSSNKYLLNEWMNKWMERISKTTAKYFE